MVLQELLSHLKSINVAKTNITTSEKEMSDTISYVFKSVLHRRAYTTARDKANTAQRELTKALSEFSHWLHTTPDVIKSLENKIHP